MNTKFEIFTVITTSKKGELVEKRKSVAKCETPDEMETAINKQRAKKNPHFVVADYDNAKEHTHLKVRQNYRISTQVVIPTKAKESVKS